MYMHIGSEITHHPPEPISKTIEPFSIHLNPWPFSVHLKPWAVLSLRSSI